MGLICLKLFMNLGTNHGSICENDASQLCGHLPCYLSSHQKDPLQVRALRCPLKVPSGTEYIRPIIAHCELLLIIQMTPLHQQLVGLQKKKREQSSKWGVREEWSGALISRRNQAGMRLRSSNGCSTEESWSSKFTY